jgi:4-diphosphocytidyl-2-C-methyl-D-erythritol kinase
MLNFPNAKLNLGLRILNKRPDGFHNIESIFYPVNYCDALEIIPSESFSFESNNDKFSQEAWDNLCVKAYELLRVDFELPTVKFYLHKNIPIGAGLGGGSSDASFMLKMLNEIFNLKLTDDKLESYAAQLGSDCVFFIKNKPALVTGRGEQLQPIEIDLSRYSVIIATPALSVDTTLAYKLWDELMGTVQSIHELPLKEIIKLPVEEWKEHLKNDFENVIFNEYPLLKTIKEKLYEEGAYYASLSGSGSSLFALFERDENIKDFLDKKLSSLGVNVTLFSN